MRYEDMKADPHLWFGHYFKFLGMKVPPDHLADAIDSTSFNKLKAAELSAGFKEKPSKSTGFFRKGKSGGWRDELTEKQVKRLIHDHREQMERFGYIPEDYR